MSDPLDKFFEGPEIIEETTSPSSQKKETWRVLKSPVRFICVRNNWGRIALYDQFINPQSSLNPLPPITMPALFLTYTPSSTPKLGLPPTWTPTISPTDTPTSTPMPTDTLMSEIENSTTPTADLEKVAAFDAGDGSPTPETDAFRADDGCNLLRVEDQVYDVDGLPGNPLLASRINETQAASASTAPIPTEQLLSNSLLPDEGLSDLFTPEIQYWEDEILAWAEEYKLDPNLIATVMQIESCGYSRAKSIAGALGLFQVMPQHFKGKEDPYDPDTNAFRGLSWLQKTLKSGGSTGMALAGYNAGIARAKNPYLEWPNETQRYVDWGSKIYQDTQCGYDYSIALDNWLSKGGSSLCNRAAVEQQDQ